MPYRCTAVNDHDDFRQVNIVRETCAQDKFFAQGNSLIMKNLTYFSTSGDVKFPYKRKFKTYSKASQDLP